MKQRKIFHWILIILSFETIYSVDLTNLCTTNNFSCNCTLINNTNLYIICNSSSSLTQLPTLQPSSLQTNVLQLHISSSIPNAKGPLISLPTNICSYPNIAILDLSNNNINGLVNTSQLACLATTLIQVDFSYNSINEIDQNLFKSNQNLQTINFSHNNLTLMPSIDGETFVSFPSSIISMNFSYNQITSVDLWPLFVRTRKSMTIDMSYNLIANYINTVPISIAQFTETPDPRYFYLNNNQITYLSDLLLEQYGACPTTDPISTAYFIVGISNLLLTNNQLVCDCQSYQLITYINDGITDFPDIFNGTALLTQATCSSPAIVAGQPYLSTDFTQFNNCDGYTLPNITEIFCSLTTNDTRVTLTPPTYWPSTTTTIRSNTTATTNLNTQNPSSSSMSSSWYIILGVVLGLVAVVGIILGVCYFFREKCFPKKYRPKFLNNVRINGKNSNNCYDSIIRNSENLSEKNLKLNGIKPRRVSIATSAYGFDEQDKRTEQLSNGGLKSPRDHQSSNGGTQTNFPPLRSKPPTGRSLSTRTSQQKDNNDTHSTSQRDRKLSVSTGTDAATNTINVIKGIPIASVPPKIPSIPSNGNDILPDTSMSELSVRSIPLTPSKRAKILPQVKSGMYDESTNENLLNTSAGALVTSQRQRRRSSLWFRKQNQNMISPLPPRPQSMVTQKTNFDYDGSFDEDIPAIPTIESLKNKPSKPLRTVPLLNISVVPAWVDEMNDQT